ncbi:response regulator [Leptolyngbya sp. 15MV]|nr:response regulator [Leptolyngbya sp. 15MV]
MKILVVDDSAFMRNAISKMIALDPSLQVVGTAGNGQIALDKIAELKPDVVTLDIEMPVMDGLTALRKIQALPEPRPAVLMCSSLTKQGSHEALTALPRVDRHQVIPALPGLARHARRHDHHVRPLDVLVVEGARDPRVEALHRPAAGQVERLAPGHVQLGLLLVRDIQQNNVSQLLHRDGAGALAADVAGANDRDLRTTHSSLRRVWPSTQPPTRRRGRS